MSDIFEIYRGESIVRKKLDTITITAAVAVMAAGVLLTGCSGKAESSDNSQAQESQAQEAPSDGGDAAQGAEAAGDAKEAAAAEGAGAGRDMQADADALETPVPGAPYFAKGVYVNYAKEAEDPEKTYFYVFQHETYGHTDDGTVGIGLPFDVVQEDKKVKFTFGGVGEDESVLIVTSYENGVVTGYFEDVPERELVFEPVEGEDPDSFVAENYVNGPENCVYHDDNGWSIRYNADYFNIDRKDNQRFIVYTGESAGTNMITVTYTVENRAEAAIKELGESWGSKDTTYSQGPFPGAAEDVTGYRASLPPSGEGSGLYMEAVGRDYMDGALIFELTGHMAGDEELDMEVSDRLAGIIDSLTFDFENTQGGESAN